MTIKTAIFILCLVGLSFGAKYRGQNIDGKKNEASVKGKGVISPARVTFDGRYVEIQFDKRTVTAKMAGEDIENPHDIEATDGTDSWIIDVAGLD